MAMDAGLGWYPTLHALEAVNQTQVDEEVIGAERPYRAASACTAGLGAGLCIIEFNGHTIDLKCHTICSDASMLETFVNCARDDDA